MTSIKYKMLIGDRVMLLEKSGCWLHFFCHIHEGSTGYIHDVNPPDYMVYFKKDASPEVHVVHDTGKRLCLI